MIEEMTRSVLNVGGNSKAIALPPQYGGFEHLLVKSDNSGFACKVFGKSSFKGFFFKPCRIQTKQNTEHKGICSSFIACLFGFFGCRNCNCFNN